MPLNASAKGARAERRSMAVLEANGYRCTRSAASRGAWDIIAISAADVLLIQVKSNNWPSAVEMEALKEFPAPINTRRLVHRWRDRQSFPDVRAI